MPPRRECRPGSPYGTVTMRAFCARASAVALAACCLAACLTALAGCGCERPQAPSDEGPPPPVPAYPGSSYVAERPYAEGSWKEYECPTDLEEVAGWYAEGQGGWELHSRHQEGDTVVLRMAAGTAVAEVLLDPSEKEEVATLISARVVSADELERERERAR